MASHPPSILSIPKLAPILLSNPESQASNKENPGSRKTYRGPSYAPGEQASLLQFLLRIFALSILIVEACHLILSADWKGTARILWLNYRTFSSKVMFAARNVGWLNHRTNVDEPSNSCLCADSDAVSDSFLLL